jgi:uncharacterized protein YqeY
MSLRDRLNDAVKTAMKAKDPRRVATLRLVLSALKDRDIANRTEDSRAGIADDEILSLLAKMIKQREESAAAYTGGGRPELAEAERAEILIIKGFMPQQMSPEAAKAAAAGIIAETGAASMKDMGKVMALLKERYTGQMDFAAASATVKGLLAGAG